MTPEQKQNAVVVIAACDAALKYKGQPGSDFPAVRMSRKSWEVLRETLAFEVALHNVVANACNYHSWTEESANNGWRSSCRHCGLKAQGSGQ